MAQLAMLLKRPTFYFKFAELTLACLCSALVAGNVHVGWVMLSKIQVIYTTIMGYIMINLITIFSYLFNTPLHKFICLLISTSGALMFITSGALMCEFYTQSNSNVFLHKDRLLGSGIMAFVACAVYVLDTLFTYKEAEAPGLAVVISG